MDLSVWEQQTRTDTRKWPTRSGLAAFLARCGEAIRAVLLASHSSPIKVSKERGLSRQVPVRRAFHAWQWLKVRALARRDRWACPGASSASYMRMGCRSSGCSTWARLSTARTRVSLWAVLGLATGDGARGSLPHGRRRQLVSHKQWKVWASHRHGDFRQGGGAGGPGASPLCRGAPHPAVQASRATQYTIRL